MKYRELKNKLLQNPEFRKEYQRFDLKRDIARMIIEARIIKKITQAELAAITGTKQPSIARLENGKSLPSLSFLEKIAKALKTKLVIKFGFMEASTNVENDKLYSITETYTIGQPSVDCSYKREGSPSFAFNNYC